MTRAERKTARRELAYAARNPEPAPEPEVVKPTPKAKTTAKSTAKKK